MLIFDNTQVSGTFSVVLRDKDVVEGDVLTLRLTKLDDFSESTFNLVNTSTSADYYTYTINPSTLKQGDYKAQIQKKGTGATADCEVNTQEVITEITYFDCDPLELNAELVVENLAVFDNTGPVPTTLYVSKCRVEGTSYNTVYRNESEPTYYVYNE